MRGMGRICNQGFALIDSCEHRGDVASTLDLQSSLVEVEGTSAAGILYEANFGCWTKVILHVIQRNTCEGLAL
jgi:hypothetical protein